MSNQPTNWFRIFSHQQDTICISCSCLIKGSFNHLLCWGGIISPYKYHILYIIIHCYTFLYHIWPSFYRIVSSIHRFRGIEIFTMASSASWGLSTWIGRSICCTYGVSHGPSWMVSWRKSLQPMDDFFGTGLDTYELSVRPWDLAHVEHCLTNTNMVLRCFKMFEGSN